MHTHSTVVDETMKEHEFWERYGPVETPGQEGQGSYLMDYNDVKDLDAHSVWTVVEGEDGIWVIAAGFHIVNKLGYLVTEKPWVSGGETGYYQDPDDYEDMLEEDANING